MAAISNFQISLQGATWVDFNTLYTANNLPDRLPDTLAITYGSLVNLFNCSIGQRSRIFQPQYGMLWLEFLQEPIDQITANKMQMGMLQALAKWEPRIQVNMGSSYVTPDLTLPGYQVGIYFTMPLTSQRQAMTFAVTP
ncbi:MAG: GPW/gp25 family protein [Candidatus Micrarchaeaceae archaeon]